MPIEQEPKMSQIIPISQLRIYRARPVGEQIGKAYRQAARFYLGAALIPASFVSAWWAAWIGGAR